MAVTELRRVQMREANRRARARAQEYVDLVRAATSCAVEGCERGTIEWHNPEHDQNPNRRIYRMVGSSRSIAAIAAEIAASIPLCRFHHVRVDGRIKNLELSRSRKAAAAKAAAA